MKLLKMEHIVVALIAIMTTLISGAGMYLKSELYHFRGSIDQLNMTLVDIKTELTRTDTNTKNLRETVKQHTSRIEWLERYCKSNKGAIK